MNVWVKRICIFCLIPIILAIILSILLYIPAFQNFAVRQATYYASKSTGMHIGIERIRLSFPIQLKVIDHLLPTPDQWSYHLDLWQHPSAVARAEGLQMWSDEHFEALRQTMIPLAKAGQKVITATLNKDPWNHQCYDCCMKVR